MQAQKAISNTISSNWLAPNQLPLWLSPVLLRRWNNLRCITGTPHIMFSLYHARFVLLMTIWFLYIYIYIIYIFLLYIYMHIYIYENHVGFILTNQPIFHICHICEQVNVIHVIFHIFHTCNFSLFTYVIYVIYIYMYENHVEFMLKFKATAWNGHRSPKRGRLKSAETAVPEVMELRKKPWKLLSGTSWRHAALVFAIYGTTMEIPWACHLLKKKCWILPRINSGQSSNLTQKNN